MTEKFELVSTKKDQISNLIDNVNSDNVTKDFSQSQAALQTVVDIGSRAVSELGSLASASQSPEHYTALAQLIKTVSDASGNLVKLHKALEDVKNRDNKDSKPNTIYNNLNFNGSTAELAQALKGKDK